MNGTRATTSSSGSTYGRVPSSSRTSTALPSVIIRVALGKTSPPTRYSNTSTCAVPLFSTDATNEGGNAYVADPGCGPVTARNRDATSVGESPSTPASPPPSSRTSPRSRSGSTPRGGGRDRRRGVQRERHERIDDDTRVGGRGTASAEAEASRSPTSSRCPRPSTDSHPPEDDDFFAFGPTTRRRATRSSSLAPTRRLP